MSRRDGVPSAREGVVIGPIRIDASVRALARRVQPGDVAVIDVLDLDRASAEALAAARPAAVLNVQQSISGRYPAGGASVLVDAGIPLVDRVDAAILTQRDGLVAVIDFLALAAADAASGGEAGAPGTQESEAPAAAPGKGSRKRKGLASPGDADASRAPDGPADIDAPGDAARDDAPDPDSGLWRARIEIGGLELRGCVMDAHAIAAAMQEARSGMSTQLAVFTANAMDVVERAGAALLEGEGLPEPGVELRGRHVVVVAPGFGAAKALRSIRPYLRDHRPVVIAVGEAAETARKAGCQPHVVIGSTEGLSEPTVAKARHVISHGGSAGAADPNEARMVALRRSHATSDLAIASEDLALLVAAKGGAEAIVTVGVDATFPDLLDSGRPDAAGTFLARLSVGARLIDARALAAVYRPRWFGGAVVASLLLAVAALGAALWVNEDARAWISSLLGVGS